MPLPQARSMILCTHNCRAQCASHTPCHYNLCYANSIQFSNFKSEFPLFLRWRFGNEVKWCKRQKIKARKRYYSFHFSPKITHSNLNSCAESHRVNGVINELVLIALNKQIWTAEISSSQIIAKTLQNSAFNQSICD